MAKRTCGDVVVLSTQAGVSAIVQLGCPLMGCDCVTTDGIFGAAVFATGDDAIKLLKFAHTLYPLDVEPVNVTQEE